MIRKSIICLIFMGFSLVQIVESQIQPSIVVWGFRCPFDYLCETAKQNGISALELLPTDKWEKAKQNGLQVLVANGADLGIERGFCNPDFHKQLQERYLQIIPQAAANGIKMIICYSGINPDSSPEQAMENCVTGLKPVIECAEKYNVILAMELISSKPSKSAWWQHTFPYYACNNIVWGTELADKVKSPNFKLIYDVWQMNDMGANCKDDIQKYYKYIALYHISGKDRTAITADDPIDYPAIIKTIRETGYTGYIGMEFLIEKNIPESIRFAVSEIKNQ